jgi:RimJ/RimL family protein N-acetyltransferase
VQYRPWPWDYALPTFGAWDDRGALVGYVQFSISPELTWQWGVRVTPALRQQGLGRRLFVAWLMLSRRMGAQRAITAAQPENTAMRRLCLLAGFQEREMIPGVEEIMYVGEQGAFAWAASEPAEDLGED